MLGTETVDGAVVEGLHVTDPKESNVLTRRLSDPVGGADALGVGQQHHFEHNLWVVGGTSSSGIERREDGSVDGLHDHIHHAGKGVLGNKVADVGTMITNANVSTDEWLYFATAEPPLPVLFRQRRAESALGPVLKGGAFDTAPWFLRERNGPKCVLASRPKGGSRGQPEQSQPLTNRNPGRLPAVDAADAPQAHGRARTWGRFAPMRPSLRGRGCRSCCDTPCRVWQARWSPATRAPTRPRGSPRDPPRPWAPSAWRWTPPSRRGAPPPRTP